MPVWFLLQRGSPLAARSNTNYAIPLIVIAVLIISMTIYNNYVEKQRQANKPNRKKSTSGSSSSTASPSPSGFSLGALFGFEGAADRREIRSIAAYYGLNKEQAAFFHTICKNRGIKDPHFLLQNVNSLDSFFSKVFHQLNDNRTAEKESEHKKTLLFTIREAIESKRRLSHLISTTKALTAGQAFSFYTKAGEQYPSKILDNSTRGMLCELPRDAFQNEIRLPPWSPIDLFFYTKSGQSYKCTTRVSGYETGKGSNLMLMAHTDRIIALPNRKHTRRSLDTACKFCHVAVETVINGRNSEHRFYPSNRNFDGSINDISVGGCSLTTLTPPKVGEYIQIEFSMDESQTEAIVGKIVKLNKIDGKTAIAMHVQFVKMKRATMNRIFSYIYNYGDT